MKVLTLACCDLFHHGHLNLFERASRLGNLIVGIPTNWTIKEHTKGNDMIYSAESRLRLVQACKYVDFAFVYADVESASRAIEIIKPDLYVRGDDWQDFPLRDKIEEMNIPIRFLPYTEGISSTKIKEDICKIYSKQSKS